jgi:WD40 repeat protein
MGLYGYDNKLLKSYRGHKNEYFCIDAKFVKNKHTNKYMILSGSEDGKVCGWDLNSQRLLFTVSAFERKIKDMRLATNKDIANQHSLSLQERERMLGGGGFVSKAIKANIEGRQTMA